MFRVVETDNFCGDYPNEKWASDPLPSREEAQRIADERNKKDGGELAPRYWMVRELPYKLAPGFEP